MDGRRTDELPELLRQAYLVAEFVGLRANLGILPDSPGLRDLRRKWVWIVRESGGVKYRKKGISGRFFKVYRRV